MLTMQGSFYCCYVLPFLAGGHAVAFDALYLWKSKEEFLLEVNFDGMCLSADLFKVSLKRDQFSSRLLLEQWAKNSDAPIEISLRRAVISALS